VWEVFGYIKIWIRDKIQVSLKNEIRRLEFVSDKIEARDSRSNVVRIHFGQPPKKNGLGWGFPCMGVVMAGLRAPWLAMGARQRGKGGGREERSRGHS
jgi:hypothetical protein